MKQWINGGLALLCLAAMAGCRQRPPRAQVEIVVNGQAISVAEVDLEQKMSGGLSRAETVEELVDQALMLQEAARAGVNLPPDELENSVLGVSAPADEELKRTLARMGVDEEQWRSRIRRQALCDEIVRRKIRSQIVIGRQEILDYYWEHVSQFKRPIALKLSQIFCVKRLDSERARSELDLGEPFASVAQRYSEGPEAAQGGDLGWVSRNGLPQGLAQEVWKLKRNKVSGILVSAYGFHVLRVDDVRMEGNMTPDEASPEIYETLVREREQPLYRNWLYTLRSNADIARPALLGN
ncbi:MAG: peptidylprolyl isomerase [candidate division FCPU426 bacterium]